MTHLSYVLEMLVGCVCTRNPGSGLGSVIPVCYPKLLYVHESSIAPENVSVCSGSVTEKTGLTD